MTHSFKTMPPAMRGSLPLAGEILPCAMSSAHTLPRAVRSFSTSSSLASREMTSRQRRTLRWYLNTGTDKQKMLRKYLVNQEDTLGGGDYRVNSPTYVGKDDMPFPDNPLFKSQPVLNESMKNLIYEKIIRRGDTLKAVSAEMGVDIRRVAAVVRMKEIETQWKTEGKKLATCYRRAVMGMLPQATFYEDSPDNRIFEPINDLHIHKWAMNQLWVPVSESHRFTRQDAAIAFHERLLPAEKRAMHPELIEMEKRVNDGVPRAEAHREFITATQNREDQLAAQLARKKEKDAKATIRHQTPRFEFRIKKIDADNVGVDGKARDAVGWRYGAPFDDRKRGKIKIPTSVP